MSGQVDQVPVATYARLSRGLRGWLRSAREAGLEREQIRALVTMALDDHEGQAAVA